MNDDEFFNEFGITFEDAEKNLQLLKENNERLWGEVIDHIEKNLSRTSVKDILDRRRDLMRRKSIAERMLGFNFSK